MVERMVAGVVSLALGLVGCGADRHGSASGEASGGGNGSAGQSGGGTRNGNAAGAGVGTGGNASAGASGGTGAGQGGSTLVGTGDGELDSSCMMRTSHHLAGDRITLRGATTAAGDKAFIGFYDNEKKIECDVVLDAEGKYRCMPPAYDKDMNNRFFLDDTCTDEVQYQGACALAYEAEPLTADSCDKRRRIYPFGDPLPDTMVYTRRAGGDCQPYNVLNNLHRRGPELVPEEWAELTPALWRGKGRLWARGYEGGGGLHLVRSFVDSQLDQDCEFTSMPDGAIHCVPVRRGNLDGYTDASCKQQLLFGSSNCGGPLPTYASYRPADACLPGVSFVRAEAAYQGPLYVRSSCMPSMNPQAVAFSVQPVPDSHFQTLTSRVSTVGGGRLKPMYLSAADGGCFFNDWWDEELQTSCAFVNQYRGAPYYYCLPQSDPTSPSQFIEAFSDVACKTSTPYVEMPSCDAKPPRYIAHYQPSCVAAWRTVHVVDPTPAVLPAALYVNSSGSCEPYTPDAAATYYAAGPPLPNSMFVQAAPDP